MRDDDAGDAFVGKPIHDLEHLADSLRFERAGWLVIQHPGQLHRADDCDARCCCTPVRKPLRLTWQMHLVQQMKGKVRGLAP
jgi:hypothetical protein